MRYKKQKEIKEKRNTKTSENTDKKIFEECKKE